MERIIKASYPRMVCHEARSQPMERFLDDRLCANNF